MISDRLKFDKVSNYEPQLKYFVWGIIVAGILLRLVVYLQCNSMFLDEANVARNIYERSYLSLTKPLNYYQYAPPVFLWIVKAGTALFGFSEYAYRIFPVLCGFFSLCLMYAVLQYYTAFRGAWYVILLLAFGPIYIHYASATKQYVPDMFIGLVLIWLALKNEINRRSDFKLFFIWAIAGSIAIWSSMPSVFILAGVGTYYFYSIVKSRKNKRLTFLMSVGVIWVIQFAFYYMVILRPQANSEYLQNYHKDYFFYLPVSGKIFAQDVDLFFSVIATSGGHLVLAMVLNITCIVIAIVYLARNNADRLILIIVPLVAVLFAAAMHQYTLIPRVILFAMPLLLILIATGMDKLLGFGPVIFRILVIVVAIINVVNFNALKNFIYPMQQEEMKQSLDFLKQRQIKGNELYVEQFGVPAYIYYTAIHPQKERWATLLGADTLQWGINFDSLAKTFPTKSAMLYSWDEDWKINDQQRAVRSNVTLVDSNIVKGGRVYVYNKR